MAETPGGANEPIPSFVADEPRLAATVMLLRDGPGELQVLLLKRHQRSDVHGGVHVFPGGKVDEADAISSRARLGEGHALKSGFADCDISIAQAAILYTAALRELFEECGVTIADVRSIHPQARWITPQPSTSAKRFDTWFFTALLPAGEMPQQDEHEIVECVWLRPRDALEAYWLGTIQLAVPQLISLAGLARHTAAQDAFDAARTTRPPRIQPEHVKEGANRVLVLPGDPLHSVREAAVPGLTRLIWRSGRYEPMTGFEAFFP